MYWFFYSTVTINPAKWELQKKESVINGQKYSWNVNCKMQQKKNLKPLKI